jgi:hypothetical protein
MLLLALGAGALVATSQLGVAYGLGIVRLTRPFAGSMADHWPSQLTWFAWLAMVSAAAGTWIAGELVRRRPGHPSGTIVTVGLSAAAAIGACVVVPLAMQPARTAQVAGTDTVLVVGITALLGALAGGAVGYAVLTWWTARLSAAVTTAAMWLLALLSVLPSLRTTDPLPAVRLGGIDPAVFAATTSQRLALFTMPAVALIAGALLGWHARRRELGQALIVTAGLAGPAMLAAAYLIGGPGDGGQRYQSVPYWAAIGAVFAGVLGSLLAGLIRRTTDQPADQPTDEPTDQPAEDRPADDLTRPAGRWEDDPSGSGAPAGAFARYGSDPAPDHGFPAAPGPDHDFGATTGTGRGFAAGPGGAHSEPVRNPAAGHPDPTTNFRTVGHPAERHGQAPDFRPSGPPPPAGGDPELSDLFARRTIPEPRPDSRPDFPPGFGSAPDPMDPHRREPRRPGMSSLRRRPADSPLDHPHEPPTGPRATVEPPPWAADPPEGGPLRDAGRPHPGAAPGAGPLPRPRNGATPSHDPVPQRDTDYVDWVTGLNKQD